MAALTGVTTRAALEEKERKLLAGLAAMERVIVAFCGHRLGLPGMGGESRA
jgi:hypothetical protein